MRIIILLAALGFAATAIAAPETGSRVDRLPIAPGSEDWNSPEAAVRVMNGLGRCQAHTHPKPASAILALPFAEPEQDQAVRRAYGGIVECMGTAYGELRFTGPLIVGAMAEQLIADRKPTLEAAAASGSAALPAPRNALEDISDCMFVEAGTDVLALLQTKPTTREEVARMALLKPVLGRCLPANQTFRLSPPMVRAIVAVGAYRRLVLAAQ